MSEITPPTKQTDAACASEGHRAIKAAKYFYTLLRLVIHTGVVWGVKPNTSLPSNEVFDDWARRASQTPMKYEVDRLEAMRKEIYG